MASEILLLSVSVILAFVSNKMAYEAGFKQGENKGYNKAKMDVIVRRIKKDILANGGNEDA